MKNGRKRKSWPVTALNLAFSIADSRSEDPYRQVGAVAIKKDGSIVAGYNGAPSGIDIDWSDRDARQFRAIHAEENVLNFCKPGEVDFLAVTCTPCYSCIKTIAAKRISKVYYCLDYQSEKSQLVIDLAKEFKIELIQIQPD
tara:strand:+ start:2509 stop:2934 length:426 start_codon:yes stop_codon:yes gene_type:complete